MIMLKLIEAKLDSGDRNTINIRRCSNLKRMVPREEKLKNWTTARFTQQVLNVAFEGD